MCVYVVCVYVVCVCAYVVAPEHICRVPQSPVCVSSFEIKYIGVHVCISYAFQSSHTFKYICVYVNVNMHTYTHALWYLCV